MSTKKTIPYSLFGRLIKYALPYKYFFGISVICILSLSILGPLRPYIIGDMVDKYIIKSQNQNKLLFWSMIVVLILTLEGILQLCSTYISNLLAQSVIRDLRKKIFQHLLWLMIKEMISFQSCKRYAIQSKLMDLITNVKVW